MGKKDRKKPAQTTARKLVEPILQLEPGQLEHLKKVGQLLPHNAFECLFREAGVTAFSDYAGDDKAATYETYATYVSADSVVEDLANAIRRMKEAKGIMGRTLDFKSRKDRMQSQAQLGVLGFTRIRPGLIIVLCIDKAVRALHEHRIERPERAKHIAAAGHSFKPETANRLLCALTFLPIIGRFFRHENGFMWTSDRDKIFDIPREIVDQTLAILMHDAIGPTPIQGGAIYVPEPSLRQEATLGIADICAGVLSMTLPTLFRPGAVANASDGATMKLLERLAQFDHPFQATGSNCRLLIQLVTVAPKGSPLPAENFLVKPTLNSNGEVVFEVLPDPP